VSWRGSKLAKVSGDTSWIPEPGDARGSIYWPGAMFMDGGRLFTFGGHIIPKEGGWDALGQDLAEFSWPACEAPTFKGMWTTPSSGRPEKIVTPEGLKYFISWSAGALTVNGYLYIYGYMTQDGWFGRRLFSARVPSGNVTNLSKWQYWNGTTWIVGNEASAAPIVSENQGPEGTSQFYYEGGQFKFISKKDGTFGSDVQRWSSPNPTGPWTLTHLIDVPYTDWDGTYAFVGHPSLPRINGQMLMSYSHQHSCWPLPDNSGCDPNHAKPEFPDLWDHSDMFRNVWKLVAV
jgi:hypothetical protein